MEKTTGRSHDGYRARCVVIGENIHATRVVRRSSPNVEPDEDGREANSFVDNAGVKRSLPVSEAERASATTRRGGSSTSGSPSGRR